MRIGRIEPPSYHRPVTIAKSITHAFTFLAWCSFSQSSWRFFSVGSPYWQKMTRLQVKYWLKLLVNFIYQNHSILFLKPHTHAHTNKRMLRNSFHLETSLSEHRQLNSLQSSSAQSLTTLPVILADQVSFAKPNVIDDPSLFISTDPTKPHPKTPSFILTLKLKPDFSSLPSF